MKNDKHEELLILAPKCEIGAGSDLWQPAPYDYQYPDDLLFKEVVEEFVDEGVYFPYDANQTLPVDLPEDLSGFRCIVIDPERQEEFEADKNRKKLKAFEAGGGFVVFARLTRGYIRMWVHRTMLTANLTRFHSQALQRQRDFDENTLVNWWLSIIPEKAKLYNRYAWGDPVAYHFYWPVLEAADHFNQPTLMEPVWDTMLEALQNYPDRNISCGRRFALKLHERTGHDWILERVLDTVRKPERRHWQLNGVSLNMDLTAPEGVDPSHPPESVLNNLWVWPETAGNMGDSLGYLSKVTGNPEYADQAIRQVLTTHKWCFNRKIGLWYHVGRPDGPDMDSAPWGRGCGWMLYGVRGLLEDLPQNHPRRDDLVAILRDGLEGWLKWQDEYGLWNNVIDEDLRHSRHDSCVTWMVINTYARAYWKNWLRDERIPEMLEKAWLGLKTKIWRGLPIAHCDGTSCMTNRQTYLARPHMRFISGAVMLACIEMQRMRGVQD